MVFITRNNEITKLKIISKIFQPVEKEIPIKLHIYIACVWSEIKIHAITNC